MPRCIVLGFGVKLLSIHCYGKLHDIRCGWDLTEVVNLKLKLIMG